MKIGMIGMGKLGLPVALAINSKGHIVTGYDPNPLVGQYLEDRKIPFREEGSQQLLDTHTITFKTLESVVKNSDIIFIAVQTPHDEKFEGITRIPEERQDFDYGYLKEAIKNVSAVLDEIQESRIVVVISTVLPTTVEFHLRPLMSKYLKLCYNPFFIAMGTTIYDFLNPEFVLFGVDDKEAVAQAEHFYSTLHARPFYKTTIRNAELIKVTYNTYISMKIAYANTIMEICHKLHADVDEVMGAIKIAGDRLMSGKYLTGGMGDGGGCHPRDNIAMSWLAKQVNLSHNFFDDIMMARENQTDWLASLCEDFHKARKLPVIILGKAFKEQTNLTSGSPAILLKNLLEERGIEAGIYDPHVDNTTWSPSVPAIYFVATRHEIFKTYKFPYGSVVLDVWRYLNIEDNGVQHVRIGGSKH
jgi:UDPglucose 6-dehydrogenase